MSDTNKREWCFCIKDMISFAEKASTYIQGLDQSEFVCNQLVYDAVLRNLELIGEAATHIPLEVRDKNPSIPWRMIIATRNRLIHGYLGLDSDTIWSVLKDDLPPLVESLKVLIDEIQ